ncbi:similar to Pc13g00030 [Aspergillus luchuensis]|uniref:Similar to Pc13g00030 n=1 Tax=Aspergillus kawachii TaxID=1069201 RepID=A0A146FM35_ASPKA|nr:similar to Pc13g00030 [Aspergillus luchuensis]
MPWLSASSRVKTPQNIRDLRRDHLSSIRRHRIHGLNDQGKHGHPDSEIVHSGFYSVKDRFLGAGRIHPPTAPVAPRLLA